jgi:hypothetical protein
MELGLERHAEQPALLGDAPDPLGQVRRRRAVVHVHEAQPALTGVGREARRVVRHPVPVQRTVVREDEHGHLPSRLSSFISQNWRGM